MNAAAVPIQPGTTHGCFVPQGENVYVWEGNVIGELPATVGFDGHVYFRFMDVIYLPAPPDELSVQQIQVVNRIRLQLLSNDRFAEINVKVKKALARLIEKQHPNSVLEWGCGYQSIQNFLHPEIDYTGVDVDPAVVAMQQQQGVNCFLVSEIESGAVSLPSKFDVIVGVFVFFFNITRGNIAVMTSALVPDGIIVFNVYRRSSNARDELVAKFEDAGLTVERVVDGQRACRDHEYWCAVRPRFREKARRVLVGL